MLLHDVVFGQHALIERYFRLAGRPLQPFAPAFAVPP
jgi:hypothetical protein